MCLTKKEVFDQYNALKKSYDYMLSQKESVRSLGQGDQFKKICYLGSGSSYCLCKSAEMNSLLLTGRTAFSMAAGDLMMNFPKYKEMLEGALLVALSRSGATSEVVGAVRMAKEELGLRCVSLCAKTASPLYEIADLSLEMPWCFDESVCQTRTVTNLYAALLMVNAIWADNDKIISDIERAISNGKALLDDYAQPLKLMAEKDWDNAFVLADGELYGLASEGAIVFNEISQADAGAFHILDVRHGPIVTMNEKSMVVLAVSHYGEAYQRSLVRDMKNTGATVITVGCGNTLGEDLRVKIPEYTSVGVDGIPFILVPQLLAYFRAMQRGFNPDVPKGLDAWVDLSSK